MSVNLRASRTSYPRATPASSLLLLIAFTLFGVWADWATELDANAHPSAALAEQRVMRCGSHTEGWADAMLQERMARSVSARCEASTVLDKVC